MWKDIKGWENLYEICDDGNVRNKITNRIVVGDKNSIGYCRVCLYNKHHVPPKQRYFRHRLVAEHFIENPKNLPEVNHINNDITNNYCENLEWVTRVENEYKSHVNGNKKYTPFHIEYDNGEIKTYHIVAQLSRELGVTRRTVLNWLQNKNKGFEKYNIREIKYL